MTTTPDPQTVREIPEATIREQARNIILDHAKDVKYLSIGEMIADFDEFSSLSEDEFDRVQGRIDKQIRNATVTVSWPDEQPQDERDGTGAAADLRVWLDSRNGDDQLGRDIRAVLDNREVWRNLAKSRGAKQDARIVELERELLALRGTELNPSRTILDAESYGVLRDELARTMGDEWDGEDSESYILVQYVRWLVAGQPRDEDGYPIRRETYPAADASAAQAERDGDVRAVAALLNSDHDISLRRSELRARFAGRIAELDAREAEAGQR